ncbi:hypothetical protein ACT17_09315 [Mycolicibacterium conceptionense]|uniref:Uncharacterized protein n=2 Tax=Mycolicibacterium TaxID=1866885 RepID=A0ABR5FZQ1_9MYCO|nr:hypothetical protein AA982_00165 [Mycolicibacterium senegalense]KLO53430.1 hypothetical protein ABW05_19955 [Mycolicibacterium senegalense]KMV19054.1 hypothetical protein ACT17_09315 [Mycolicibacterium conceptionense]
MRCLAPTLSIAVLGGASASEAGLRGFEAFGLFGFARTGLSADCPDVPEDADDVDECVGSATATPHPIPSTTADPTPRATANAPT